MYTHLEYTQIQLRPAHLYIILIGALMIHLVHADDAPFDAYETVRKAGIGTNYYDRHDDADAGEHHVASEKSKSETIYLHNGKTVCFKLESDVSVAYYCN